MLNPDANCDIIQEYPDTVREDLENLSEGKNASNPYNEIEEPKIMN